MTKLGVSRIGFDQTLLETKKEMFRKTKNYLDQDYYKLKKRCVSDGKLFEDDKFPASAKSISYTGDEGSDIVWKRPGELAQDPHLFVGGADASDFKQGGLGNCWFVAACACVAETPSLWKKIVPEYEEQDWSVENQYAGIFHFYFYRGGEWIDVVIDDRLPTRNGSLVYTSSNDPNEFWSALLEKAYAKLFGDYNSLTAGKGKDALVDMLGGVGQTIALKDRKDTEEKRDELFEELLEAFENNSQMTASIGASKEELESKMSNGLVKGHAYSVTSVKRIRQGTGLFAFLKNDKLDMIRLRNPWGEKEWNGPWSYGSKEWQNVSDGEKKSAGLETKDDGEFWMGMADFLENFTSMDICHMINTSFFSLKKTWSKSLETGKWTKPARAGGCGNHDSFLLNPQYAFDVKYDDEDIIVSLEQEDQRMYREAGKENATVGVSIHKCDLNRDYRMCDKLARVAVSEFTNSRSIFLRKKFAKGRYLIVPSTFDPGFEASFWLRVYCDTTVNLKALTEEGPSKTGCCGPKYKSASHITCIKAAGLEKMESGGADPFCIVRCEGEKYTTPVCKDTLSPEWDWRFVLYRTKPSSDITVEVWNHNLIKDDFMGQVVLQGTSTKTQEGGAYSYPLTGRGKEANQNKPGKLTLDLKHFNDIDDA